MFIAPTKYNIYECGECEFFLITADWFKKESIQCPKCEWDANLKYEDIMGQFYLPNEKVKKSIKK